MRCSRTLSIIILLLLAFYLQGCAPSQPTQNTDVLNHLLDDYSKVIENGVPSDMRLTLYNNIMPYISINRAVTKDDFINSLAPETVIDSTELSSRIAYLQRIDSSVLRLPERSLPRDLIVYYCIETETDGKVLEVEISEKGGTIFVNGVEVEYDPVFFELVSPYLDAWEFINKDAEMDILPHLLDDFSNAIADGVPSDMRMTLYNISPFVEYDPAIRKADIIRTDKTIIDSTQLSSRIDYLKKIDSSVLQKAKTTRTEDSWIYYKDLRIYYYIETEADGIVLDVEISGKGGTIFVNGVAVKYNPVFFDLVEPYLDT